MAGAKVDPDWLARRLEPTAEALELSLPADGLARLAVYAAQLLDWAPRINLTGARDAGTLADEHLADALALLPQLVQGAVVVDVGSGAGLPGLPVALLRPDLQVWLLEPRQRRHAFLRACLRAAGLDSGLAVHARLEEWLDASGRPVVDAAVARAVWAPAEWLKRGRALVRPGGRVLALEGREPMAELPAGARRVRYQTPHREASLIVLDTSG